MVDRSSEVDDMTVFPKNMWSWFMYTNLWRGTCFYMALRWHFRFCVFFLLSNLKLECVCVCAHTCVFMAMKEHEA